jgi:hypothetical protein
LVLYDEQNGLENLVAQRLQLAHFIVILRLALSAIFVTGLAKWFSRPYLHLIMVRTPVFTLDK